MKPQVAVFTREQPVTKLELWNCFRYAGEFSPVQVDEAHAVIGKNAPRYMEKRGYLERERTNKADYYCLTKEGEEWLVRGIKAYAKNHSAEKHLIKHFPDEGRTARRVRRVR